MGFINTGEEIDIIKPIGGKGFIIGMSGAAARTGKFKRILR